MTLDQEIKQHIWVLGICLAVTLIMQSVLVYFLSPVCLRFARAHLQAGSAHLVSLEVKSRQNQILAAQSAAASESVSATASAITPASTVGAESPAAPSAHSEAMASNTAESKK